jgi:hypothetical protein
MGHFVVHVLTESKLVRVDTNFDQEEVNTANEVTKGLVINNTLRNSIANGHDGNLGAALKLHFGGQKVQLDILDIVESRMVLVLWIDKVLNLGHSEFTLYMQP